MGDRALILGGGGPVGIAWELGLAAGLEEGGVRIADASRIVGTSAGSFAGAALASGRPAEALVRAQVEQAERAAAARRAAPDAGTPSRARSWPAHAVHGAPAGRPRAAGRAARRNRGLCARPQDDRRRRVHRELRLHHRSERKVAARFCLHGSRCRRRQFPSVGRIVRRRAWPRDRFELFGTRHFSADHDLRAALYRRRHALGDQYRSGERLSARACDRGAFEHGDRVHARPASSARSMFSHRPARKSSWSCPMRTASRRSATI